MNVLWVYRVITFVAALALGLVVLAMCVHTSSNLDTILRAFGDDTGSFPYTTLGITVGCITAISLFIMLALDFFINTIFTSMIVFELAWSLILCILWISVGATTLSEGKTIFKGHPCSDFQLITNAKNICDDIHPIAITAFVDFAVLFLYTGTLLFIAFTSSGTTPPWTTSLKNRSK
ncbi:hypothetical protein BD413DRAFT_612600 [Trametes elegans]|nr:hypothetical protein BD413DRAFT_612600 [Trametes elegans]